MSLEITPSFLKERVSKFAFSGRGEIYSYSTVYEAPTRFKEFEPYVVALVKLEEGPMITAMLTDLEQEWTPEVIDGETRTVGHYKVEIGMPVEMVTRRLWSEGPEGLIHYGYKFRPVLRP